MIDVLLLVIGLSGLIAGSITDFKTREVPDWLNYSLIASGLGLRLIYSSFTFEWSYFLYGLLGFGLFFLLALFMYYTGQWGGGDAKMLMGLGALFGTYPEFLLNIFDPKLMHDLIPDFFGLMSNSLGFLFAFLINMLFVGAIYGLIWSIFLSIKNRKKFMKDITTRLKDKKITIFRRALMILSILLMVTAFFFTDKLYQLFIMIIVFVSLFTFFMWIYVKSVENVCMYKTVPASKVTEGDWIAEDVMHEGKKVYSQNKLGIEKKDMARLVKLGVKKVVVKEGIPFVPSFFVSFLISLTLGNLVFLFIRI